MESPYLYSNSEVYVHSSNITVLNKERNRPLNPQQNPPEAGNDLSGYTGKSTYAFHELKQEGDRLKFTGYLAMDGVDYTASSNVSYNLEFVDSKDPKKVIQSVKLPQIKDASKMPYVLKNKDSANRVDTYSWFSGDINISDIPQGDYQMYISTSNGSSKPRTSRRIVTNLMYNPMVGSSQNKTKQVVFRSNYFDKAKVFPLEVFVRDTVNVAKTTSGTTNLINNLTNIKIEDNKLVLFGSSVNINVNYKTAATTKRNIIVEEISTYKQKKFTASSLANKDRPIIVVGDKTDKTFGWFEARIDLSEFSNGTYFFYIENIGEKNAFGELYSLTFDPMVLTSNGVTYSLKYDPLNRFRIQLTVSGVRAVDSAIPFQQDTTDTPENDILLESGLNLDQDILQNPDLGDFDNGKDKNLVNETIDGDNNEE